MNTAQRRTEILKLLQQEEKPVAARAMASQFGVSRQVIVQDMAVIRASTPGILSTTRGYVLQQDKDIACTREFKVRHGQEQAAEELNLIVDCGGRVKNISISHRVYGRVTAEMDIRSRQDVNEFVQAINSSHSSVLSSATSGYHYHLIEASSQERLDLIGEQLKKAGFLAPLQPWEMKKLRTFAVSMIIAAIGLLIYCFLLFVNNLFKKSLTKPHINSEISLSILSCYSSCSEDFYRYFC